MVSSASFFTSTTGTRLLRDNVSTVFPRLVREAGLDRSGRRRAPRLHDYADLCVMPTLKGNPCWDWVKLWDVGLTWILHAFEGVAACEIAKVPVLQGQ